MEDGVTTEAATQAPGGSERDRMPKWFLKGVVLFWLGFILAGVVEGVVSSLRSLLITLLVALFLSFAIEPAVNHLTIRRNWRRGVATGLVFTLVILLFAGFVFAIGTLVYNEVQDFADEAPTYLEDLEDWINDTFDTEVDLDDVADKIEEVVADNAPEAGLTVLAGVFQVLTIGLFTFYLVADGPRLRRAICSVLPPDRQQVVLDAWNLAIEKTGSYLYSRVILAGLSIGFTWIALTIVGVPYALALAIWVGVISQFIPVIGTYLAGGLAVAIAALHDPVDGIAIAIFVIVYQQVENYIFAPRVTAQIMSVHPAVAFAAVIAGAALLGPTGALLALPATAVISAFVATLGQRHEVVESELTALREPKTRRERRRDRKNGENGTDA